MGKPIKIYDIYYLLAGELRSTLSVPESAVNQILKDLKELRAEDIGVFLSESSRLNYIAYLRFKLASKITKDEEIKEEKLARKVATFDSLSNLRSIIPDDLRPDYNNLVNYFSSTLSTLRTSLEKLATSGDIFDLAEIDSGFKFTYNRRTAYIILKEYYEYYNQKSYSEGIPEFKSDKVSLDLIRKVNERGKVI